MQDSVLHKLLDSGPQILTECWSEAALSSSSYVLLHRAAHNVAAEFIRVRNREIKRQGEDGGQHLF